MSIFNELLPKINEISKAFTKNFNDDLKVAFECLDKFEEEYQYGRGRAREKAHKDKNGMVTLQSINEDEGETNKTPEDPKTNGTHRSSITSNPDAVSLRSSTESINEKPQRASKKRSKNEVDGLLSPEQEKRQKRNASVRAQSIISKQVNVNLTQKLRRENSSDKTQTSRSRRRKDEDKENSEPLLDVQIKQEKISLPPESMDMESLPVNIEVKQEPNKDEIAMPPPLAPVPKPRKAIPKDKQEDSDEEAGKRRTRTRKQTDTVPLPAAPSGRAARASGRAARAPGDEAADARPKRTRGKKNVTEADSYVEKEVTQETGEDSTDESPAPTETRPKRTRAKKKVSDVSNNESEREIMQTQENGISSPADKPRPKRTRRAQKMAEKEIPQIPITISPKEERISNEPQSPILPQKEIKIPKNKLKTREDEQPKVDSKLVQPCSEETDHVNLVLDETRVILNHKVDAAVTLTSDMDRTVVLPNGIYHHAPVTPKNIRNMNETVVIDPSNRETIVLDKPRNIIMNDTVVIDKEPKATNLTEDDSLITDDSDFQDAETPPKQEMPIQQPSSAVKEKVQQFEELASRVTRTKTRAMAKKQDDPADTQTPPDKISKPVLSAETLSKMNNMIFNGKLLQVSSSATKPRAAAVAVKAAAAASASASASKLSGAGRAREAAEESLKVEKDDARKKKEAMLEAKREHQKRKREEKMAAAAAARDAAERDRRAALHAAARDRQEKQAHADLGKIERLKEAERRKLEAARKAAETEERRRGEEAARRQRLADEQRRALAARRKQQEEAEAVKKEAAIMAKEIEKRQKEYLEKQKLKQRLEDKIHTPLKTPGTPGLPNHGMEPVYMADGFQYLNSDEDEEPADRPIPEWSTSKARKLRLYVQSQISSLHVDRLFSVRVHSPDLRDIFPDIERARLKRTSSAVWRTPPGARLPPLRE